MNAAGQPSTIDTNIAVYAFATGAKREVAAQALRASAFLSVQVLNEYVSVALRKRRDAWPVIEEDLADIREAVPLILPVDGVANGRAVDLAKRYQLSFYDALILVVASAGGARTFYSEDMHHGLLIDGTLRIIDPFR